MPGGPDYPPAKLTIDGIGTVWLTVRLIAQLLGKSEDLVVAQLRADESIIAYTLKTNAEFTRLVEEGKISVT